MAEYDHHSNNKHRRRSADSRHRHHLNTECKLSAANSPTDVESRVTNETSRNRLNREAVDLRGFSAEFASRCEFACKRRRTDHDSADESRTECSSVPSNNRTPEHLSDFRTQQSSSRLNREALRSKRDDSRDSASLLSETRHSKHRENILTKESLRNTQDSTTTQSKEENHDSKLDQEAETLPSSATANADEISTRDIPKYSLFEGKSLSDIQEESTDCNSSGEETVEMKRSDEANSTRSSLTTGSLDMLVKNYDFEFNDNIFCNNKLDLSSDSRISRIKTCSEAEADNAVNNNVVAVTSMQHVQISQVYLKSLAKQEMNIDYKTGVKRKLASNEDNTLLARMQKKIQIDTLANINMTNDDIQVSSNNERSVYDESTEDERDSVIGDNVKEQWIIQKRNKRYTKKRRDMRALSKMKATKTFKDIRSLFRNLFGENITKSESEEERAILKSKYYVVQEKSIDSCSTEARDTENDDMSVYKDDIYTPVDDSQKDVKDKSPVKMEHEMNPLVADDTKNVIGKNDIPAEAFVAKTDAQEASKVAAKVAKVNMEEYISKDEMRELLWTLRRNLMKMIENIFKREEQNDRWSSEVKQILREIQKCNNDESNFSSDKDANMHKDSNSSAVLSNLFPTKLVSDIKDRESNNNCNTVNLTLMKNDIFSENTNTMTIDHESMLKKGSVREDETCTVREDSCVDSASVTQFTNIDSILSSKDNTSSASNVIVNRSLTPTSLKESICRDEVYNVNENFGTNTDQPSTDTSNPQSLRDDITDNEVQLEIKIKAKTGFTNETFTLKIPPSTGAKYNLDNLKNNFRRMILEISSKITASANANRTEKDDASEGALNTNQVTTTKNIETMSSIQQVSYDSNHATQTSINRPLQKEDFQDDLRSINDRENVMESNEAGNDQCVQSVERESLQTASISTENGTESSTSVRSVPGLEKLPPKDSLSESKEHNEEILKKCLTAETQSGWSPPTSVNLTVAGTSDTTNSVTTVASPRVSQGSLLMSTSFVTTVTPSFSTTTYTSIGNLHGQQNSNEEIQLIDNIGNLIMLCRIFFHNNINNQLNITSDMISVIIALYNNMTKLRAFLMKNMHNYDIINYAVHRLNFSILQNYPTSAEELKKIFNLLFNMRDNRSLVVANGTNTMPSTSAQKSSQSQKSQSVQSRSIIGGEIPDIRTQVTRNTTSCMGYPNQATGTAVNEQRFENSMNNATSMLQQRQKSTGNSSQHQSSSNMDYIVQLNPNINLSRLADNTNILRMPQTNSPSTSINWQRSSDSKNNILRMQQPGASTENVERQQSSNSTNNIPRMSQPSQITTNMEQQQLSAGTNNVSYIQQLSLMTGNIEQPRSSANINNIPCIPQPSPATVNVGRQSSDNTNNILRMPLSIPLTTANIKRLSATSDILRMPRSNPATGNIEQRQSSANIKNIQFVPNSDLNNTATAPGFIPSGSTTTSISQKQFLGNNPHTSHVLNARQHATMEKYQQLDRLVGFQPSGNVSNVPRVPHLALPVLNSNQTSQSTNVAVHSSREPLREKLNIGNQQQFYPGCPEYPNFHMSLPGTENVSPHPSYVNLRNPISLPTSTITSDNVRQEQGPWMASLRTNSKGTAFIPNAQQQANFQQQSNGSTPITQNTMPNYTNVALTVPHLRNLLINSQTQICQSYRMPSSQYNIHAYSVSNNQPQSHTTGLNPLQISATKAMYQHVNVDQQSRITMHDATAKYLNNAPASITMQQTSQKTRSLRQNDFLANATATVSSNPLTNIPSNTQQSLSNAKTQKRKYTHKSKTGKTLTTCSELARQEIPENSVSSGRNIPQNSTTNAGVLVASLDVSQKKGTSSSHTRETSSAGTSAQVAQNALTKRVNESAKTSASQENPAAKSFPQKRKVETTVVTGDTSNLHTILSNVSENRSKLSNNPSNSEMQNIAQSTTAQGLSQSAAHITKSFNLNVFTDIQKLIIQSHLDTYFQMSFTTPLHIFTKQQLETWKSDRSLLRCFHGFLSEYLSKLVLEERAAELTREDEARSFLLCREQKKSARQQEMIELRRDKRLEKTIQCLRDDTKSNASKSTSEDSSTKLQNEEPLGTSNLSKPATTETPSSGLVESPQRDEDTSTLCPASLLEESNMPREYLSREDSTTETRDGAAEPDGTAESVKQGPAEQPSIDTEIKQNPTDKCKEKPGSNVRQEQSDGISVKKCEPVDVIQHETEKFENLSEDVIEINSIGPAEQPSIDTDIKQNPTDKCKEKPGSDVQQEQSDEKFVKKYEPVDVIQHETEKFENLSDNVIEINPIDLYQSSPDAKAHHFEIVNEQLTPKEKKVLEISRDFETSERVWCIEKCGQWRAQSTDTLSEDEEKGTVFIDTKLETSNEQLGHLSETRHREEPQALLIKNEGISDVDTYEKDITIKDDILAENDLVAYNFTELEDENLKLNIINICNISSTLFEKMDSNTFLSQDDQLRMLGEGEDRESARESSNLTDNSEIVNEEDVPCLRCKRNSTVCCENCLAAYYCSERCSKLHWYSSHHKHCKPYNQNLPD